MNRENKRKTFEKGYYKRTPATTLLPARSAEDLYFPKTRAVRTAIIVRIVCQACTSISNRATVKATAAV